MASDNAGASQGWRIDTVSITWCHQAQPCTPIPRPTPAPRPAQSAPPSPHATPAFTPVPRPSRDRRRDAELYRVCVSPESFRGPQNAAGGEPSTSTGRSRDRVSRSE
jgi:hypothetical protein